MARCRRIKFGRKALGANPDNQKSLYEFLEIHKQILLENNIPTSRLSKINSIEISSIQDKKIIALLR